MRQIVYFLILCFVSATVHGQHDTIPHVPAEISVTGLVDSPFFVSMESIHAFPVKAVHDFNITGPGGKIKWTIKSFKGVLLTDILSKAKITIPNEKERGTYIILVTAADGYKVIFSYNELMFGPAGSQTFLVFEEDNKPLEKNGPFIVICTSDLITGPRHVKWVKEITVKKINE